MKRIFIMRKDLSMSPGKLAAQVGHCAEAYWMHWLQKNVMPGVISKSDYLIQGWIEKPIMDDYVMGIFTKVICAAKNKEHLLKVREKAKELNLVEGYDFGFIYDNCLTELEPEEENGTTLTGAWFCPLEDDRARFISKKYQLYKE